MSEAAIFRRNADELMDLALRTDCPVERGRLISLSARWHMEAAQLEGHGPPEADDFNLDLFASDDECLRPVVDVA